MEELRITHTEKVEGIKMIEIDNDKWYSETTIIQWWKDETYKFYTLENGYKSYVTVKYSSLGNSFLVTSPDGIESNNLGSLSG